jgi:site-specific recombinase XerD
MAEEAERVFEQPNGADPVGLRDRAILETLYSTGIRCMEVIHLLVYNLDCERGTLMVRQGEGKEDGMVPSYAGTFFLTQQGHAHGAHTRVFRATTLVVQLHALITRQPFDPTCN